MNFEEHLLNGIPRDEAADFFIRIRGKNKEATVADLAAALDALPDDERAELLKSAQGLAPPTPPAPLSMTGKGQNMAPPQMMPPPPSATGQQAISTPQAKVGSAASDKTPEEKGRESARASLASEHVKDKAHRGEHRGDLMGRLGGAALGGALGHRMGKDVLSTVAGAALGQHLGGHVGRMTGANADARRYEKSAAAFAVALEKTKQWLLGQARRSGLDPQQVAHQYTQDSESGGRTGGAVLGGVLGGGLGIAAGSVPLALGAGALGALGGGYLGKHMGRAHGETIGDLMYAHGAPAVETPVAVTPKTKAAAAFKFALEQMGIEPQIDPAMQEQLAAMQQGQQAEQQNEAMYLRQQLQAAQAQGQQSMQEAQAAQAQAAQLQAAQDASAAQMQQYQTQVADATQKAVAAGDQVLQQQQAAAAMRMAFQQLRGTLLEAASAEPPSLTPTPGTDAANAQASQAAGPNSAPAPTAGPAGNAPSPGTAPGSPAPMGDETVSAPSAGNEPMFGNAENASKAETQQSGTGREPGKEVLSHYRPFPSRR